MGPLLFAQASASRAPADSPPAGASAPARDKLPSTDRSFPWFIILDSPRDLNALWQRIEHPDLIVIKADQLPIKASRDGSGVKPAVTSRWLLQAVQVRGQLTEDFANLKVEL